MARFDAFMTLLVALGLCWIAQAAELPPGAGSRSGTPLPLATKLAVTKLTEMPTTGGGKSCDALAEGLDLLFPPRLDGALKPKLSTKI
jgi:hypothetical protein